MSKHYKFGGSTAGRTINCPAWVNLSENMPKGKTSTAAAEGTMMHGMFEDGMNDETYDPDETLGQKHKIDGLEITVSEKHIEKVYTAFDVMDDVFNELDESVAHFESMMAYNEDIGGTADVIIFGNDGEYFGIGDLKTGDGHMVYAKDNPQLLFYAWLAVLEYGNAASLSEDTEIVLFIIQPSERRDDPYDEWVTDLKTVLEFGSSFKLAVREAKSGRSEANAGEWCAYCPAQAHCPAKTGMIAASKRIPANSVELKDLISALAMVDDVEAWCRSIRKTAHEQAEAGVKLEGFKMVAKRATRKWVDADEMLTICQKARSLKAEDYLDMELKSPAQLEKICKKKKIDFKKYDGNISLQSSGTTLVKESDKRPEVLALQALADMSANIRK